MTWAICVPSGMASTSITNSYSSWDAYCPWCKTISTGPPPVLAWRQVMRWPWPWLWPRRMPTMPWHSASPEWLSCPHWNARRPWPAFGPMTRTRPPAPRWCHDPEFIITRQQHQHHHWGVWHPVSPQPLRPSKTYPETLIVISEQYL